jgi:diacylglycerol kinase (ATP)
MPMNLKHVLVILNPTSGQQEALESQQLIEKALSEKGISFETRLTGRERDALLWAKEAAEGRSNASALTTGSFDAVVAAGGDGTIVEAMNGLLQTNSDMPLLVVPLGTANGLARSLKLPLEPRAALEAALEGEVASLDVGYIVNRDHFFLLFAGVGYDAQVIREADRELKDRHGLMAYIYAAFKQLRKRRNQYLTLILDGKRVAVYGHSVLMFNLNEFVLAGVPLGPKTNANDGKLDIIVLRDPTAWGTFKEVWQIATHRFSPVSPEVWQASSLRIETLRPLPFQTDGDVLGQTPLEIEVRQNAARVVAPRAYLETNREPSIQDEQTNNPPRVQLT